MLKRVSKSFFSWYINKMDYVHYVSGLENSTSGTYNLLVSGRDDFTSSSGVMIKNDTSSAPGLAIRMDSSNNTTLDHRASTSNSLSFRLHDHDTESITPLLVLKKDDKTSSSTSGASITGRVKASQFYISEPDTRAPTASGVYTSLDNNYVAHIKVNKADGTGGFVFTTHTSDGAINKVNMMLNPNGTVLIPAFDANGKLVRAYQQNRRFQSIESRTTSTEGDKTDTAIRINEIIRRINSLSVFSTEMSELVLTPGFTFPQSGLYIQDNGMSNIDGSFNAYVVYPDYRAYQLNSTNLMISGDPLVVPFDKTGWTRVGDFMENDRFSISYYFTGSSMQQLLKKSLENAKKVENFSSTTQYKGLSPWSGAKWMSIIEVR
jgi:hypothetical protein